MQYALHKYFTYIFILFSLLPLYVAAQSTNVIHKGTKTFLQHKVEKGQTLYSISKKYEVEVKAIEEANDGLKSGLKLDDIVLIPLKSNSITHTVEKGQTLYSICKLYAVSKDAVMKDNNLSDEALRLGQTLKIVFRKGEPKAEMKTELASTNNNKGNDVNPNQINQIKQEIKEVQVPNIADDKLVIALLLPLYLDKNFPEQEENKNTEETEEKAIPVYAKSGAGLEFYEGVKMACDSFGKNKNIEIVTLDCESDTDKVKQLLLKTELRRADVLIGPFNSNYAPFVAEYCKKYKKIYITPFGQVGKILLNNEYACKISSSPSTQMEHIASYISDEYKKCNYVIVHNGLKKEKNLVDAFKTKYATLFKDSIKEVLYKDLKFAGLKQRLSSSKTNVVVVCSNDQAFVTDFFNKLNGVKDDYKFVIFGTEQWQEYENLEVDILENFKVHFPSNYFIDYEDSLTKNFINSYRNEYYAEPGRASFLGFDLAHYIIKNMSDDLKPETLFADKFKALQIVFDFEKTSHESGYENHYSPIFTFENGLLKAVVK
jgi:LysM repeat protein/ABC-type branched-subunit amino acid transport system substrate-binding protein